MIYYKDNDSRKFRDTSRYFPKGVNLNVIDYKRMRDVDHFYSICQEHRDFYKNHSSNLRCVPFFQQYRKQFESKDSPTTKFMTSKLKYKTINQPIFYSIDN